MFVYGDLKANILSMRVSDLDFLNSHFLVNSKEAQEPARKSCYFLVVSPEFNCGFLVPKFFDFKFVLDGAAGADYIRADEHFSILGLRHSSKGESLH